MVTFKWFLVMTHVWLICGTDKITPTEFLLWVQFDPQVVCWIKVRKMSSAPLSLSSLTFFLTSLSYKRIYNFSMFSFSQSPFFFVLFTFVFYHNFIFVTVSVIQEMFIVYPRVKKYKFLPSSFPYSSFYFVFFHFRDAKRG